MLLKLTNKLSLRYHYLNYPVEIKRKTHLMLHWQCTLRLDQCRKNQFRLSVEYII